MQINSSPVSNSHLSWTSSKTHHFFTSYKRLKPLSFSLKASSFEFQDPKLTIPARLPVTIRRSGSVFQYSWDGNELKLISLDKRSSLFTSFDYFEDGYKRLFELFSLPVRNFFLPREISGNYVEYVKWKFLHRVFSSALQVLATQAMFRAIGIGYAHSLPSAAALNWVLKDGLGRLSRCIYTACLASAFDTNLKRVRFSTSVVFSLSVGLELLTPAFPQYFLLLASVANIAKQISLACYLATSSAVHRSFAIADNLGEVSAKAQIQSVSFDNLGLLLAASLNMLFKNSPRLQAGLPFAIYPVFTAVDLFGIYQGLKHVHLQTLTKDRLEIILNTWIEVGYIPSPAEVSNAEGIDFLSSRGEVFLSCVCVVANLLWYFLNIKIGIRFLLRFSSGRELWHIRIGCLNTKSQIPMLSMMTIQSLKNEDLYFICMEVSQHKLLRKDHLGILLCLREGAQTADVILGLLQACYIRKRLLCSATKWDTILEAYHISDLVLSDWFRLVEDSKHSALADFDLLNEKILEVGWASKNILLSTKEQARYSFLDDPRG